MAASATSSQIFLSRGCQQGKAARSSCGVAGVRLTAGHQANGITIVHRAHLLGLNWRWRCANVFSHGRQAWITLDGIEVDWMCCRGLLIDLIPSRDKSMISSRPIPSLGLVMRGDDCLPLGNHLRKSEVDWDNLWGQHTFFDRLLIHGDDISPLIRSNIASRSIGNRSSCL